MAEFKWADVAHMYLKSEILIQTNDAGIREMIGAQGTRGVMYATRAHAMLSRWSQHKPILRHLEDMTEAEAEEFFNLRERKGAWDHAFAKKTHDSFKQWFLHVSNAERMHKSSINCNLGYTPAELHWLISKGFNVFNLPWGTEAIRKGVGNG